MALPDDELNWVLGDSLRPVQTVSKERKREAWEDVRRRAFQQTMLPPLETALQITPETLTSVAWKALCYWANWAKVFFLDVECYERAYNNRLVPQHRYSMRRQPFADFVEPLRFTIMKLPVL